MADIPTESYLARNATSHLEAGTGEQAAAGGKKFVMPRRGGGGDDDCVTTRFGADVPDQELQERSVARRTGTNAPPPAVGRRRMRTPVAWGDSGR